jgi:hypothetical protein
MLFVAFTPKDTNAVPIYNLSMLQDYPPVSYDYLPFAIAEADSPDQAFARMNCGSDEVPDVHVTYLGNVRSLSAGDVLVREQTSRLFLMVQAYGWLLVNDDSSDFFPLAEETLSLFPPPNPKDPRPTTEELSLCEKSGRIQAIKAWRERTGGTLKEGAVAFPAPPTTNQASEKSSQ